MRSTFVSEKILILRATRARQNGEVTAPPRHEPTPSRRDARAQRERAARRASAATEADRTAAAEARQAEIEAEARAAADTAPIRIVRARLRPVSPPAPPLTRAQAKALARSAEDAPDPAGSPTGDLATPTPTSPIAIHLAPLQRVPPPLPPSSEAAPIGLARAASAERGDARALRSREDELLAVGVLPRPTPVHHARVRRLFRPGTSGALAVAAMLVVVSASALTAAVLPPTPSVSETAPAATVPEATPPSLVPPVAASTPLGAFAVQPQAASIDPTQIDLCADTVFTAALQSGDDAATIAAAGGAVLFRDAVAAGRAPCVALDDPARVWVVIDKERPFVPIDYRPSALAAPAGVRNPVGGSLRVDAAAALSAMAEASRAAGAGEIGVESAFRSYQAQVDTYNGHVATRGVEGADLVSARPGFSEHQSGLAVDVAPCASTCGSIDDLAASPQGAWIVEHAWEYGWIVRYEDGSTSATGYLGEPWHLRYIGPELARAYHEGEWQTLEEFLGLPPAPDYVH